MSSGFFGFYAHAGCLKALHTCGLKVQGFGGSSAGAIIAAFAASGMDPEAIERILYSIKKDDIWDPEPVHRTLFAALKFFKGWHGRLQGKKINHLLQNCLPIHDIEKFAYPCVISGTNITLRKREIFTRGSIADAVQASCTVPWLFRFKHMDESLYIDGGFVDKAPLTALADSMQPEVMIVHYLKSENLRSTGNGFIEKLFSPQKAWSLAMNIARHEHYLLQKRFLEERGIQVIELIPRVSRVDPRHLEQGRTAFEEAYAQVMRQFC